MLIHLNELAAVHLITAAAADWERSRMSLSRHLVGLDASRTAAEKPRSGNCISALHGLLLQAKYFTCDQKVIMN